MVQDIVTRRIMHMLNSMPHLMYCHINSMKLEMLKSAHAFSHTFQAVTVLLTRRFLLRWGAHLHALEKACWLLVNIDT